MKGCGGWIATAAALELLSAVGFVLTFKLVFAPQLTWRRATPASLRALGASTVMPAGGLIGPGMGAWSAGGERPSISELARSTIVFVLLTNAPAAIVLAVLGSMLWLGLPSGPHQPALTILPAALAGAVVGAAWLAGRPSTRPGRPLKRGLTDTRVLIASGDWKLAGGVAYYAFDNAVLWAAFHAFGHAPPIGVVTMGYLVGSLAGSLPLPAGLGAVEGGLIGALILYGAPAAPAVAAVLLYRGISLSVPIGLGALASVRGPGGLRRLVVLARTRRRPVPVRA